MDAGDTYLKVYEADNTAILIEPDDEPAIDAAVTLYLDTGRDCLLHLTRREGNRYVTRASNILSWFVSTPASRDRYRELEEQEKPAVWQDE